MEEEKKSLDDFGVYTLAPTSDVPQGQNVVRSNGVFKGKSGNTYKARVVAQGWDVFPGNDCGCTYAPVCRLQSIRMCLQSPLRWT